MPVFRDKYRKDVDLGDLGQFVLRELEAGEQREYNSTIAQWQADIGLMPGMTSEQRQEVMRALTEEERTEYLEKMRDLDTKTLDLAIVSWDGNTPKSPQTVDDLPTITKVRLWAEIQEMNTAQKEMEDFLGKSSVMPPLATPPKDDSPTIPRPPLPSSDITSAAR